jgi:hypothetical protein
MEQVNHLAVLAENIIILVGAVSGGSRFLYLDLL